MTAPPTDFCKFLVSTSHTTKLKKQPLFSCSYSAAISVTSTNSNHKANSTIQGRSCMEVLQCHFYQFKPQSQLNNPGAELHGGTGVVGPQRISSKSRGNHYLVLFICVVDPTSNASDPPKISGFTPATINTKVNCGKI